LHLPFELITGSLRCYEERMTRHIVHPWVNLTLPFHRAVQLMALQKACYHVPRVLLPGHGTKAEIYYSVSSDGGGLTFRMPPNQFRQRSNYVCRVIFYCGAHQRWRQSSVGSMKAVLQGARVLFLQFSKVHHSSSDLGFLSTII